MNSWHSYPSIYNIGHAAIACLFDGPVIVEEKVDGSQFSFGIDEAGELHVRSKGKEMVLDAPEKMFGKAVETVKRLAPLLHPGWTYRGEYLQSPKHNTLAYDRVPMGHIAIFDVNIDHESYLSYSEKSAEAERIGLEVVPLLFTGKVESAEQLSQLLDTLSFLGGQKIEGVVCKPIGYGLWGKDKKCLMGKYVSEAFKEVHKQSWKDNNPQSGDILDRLAQIYLRETRWNKAVQHVRDRGELEDSPRDIGGLMKEVVADVEKECEEEIKQRLWEWAWPLLRRSIVKGLPEWYKGKLLEKQFGAEG